MTVQLEVSAAGDLRLNGGPLIFRYPEGDIDLIPWPMNNSRVSTTAEVCRQLASCLFDAREHGRWGGSYVLLPDGSMFYPDDHLE